MAKALKPGKGINNPQDLGDIRKLVPGLYPYVVQRHAAQRAGLHHDLRMGKGQMYSWAVPKLVPPPGERRLAVQQPLHSEWYKHFQGKLTGYGAGNVTTADKGEVLVTSVSDDEVRYTLASKGKPERFILKRMKGGNKNWLLVNVTPRQSPENTKPAYKVIPAKEVEKVFNPNFQVEAKLDGARVLGKVLKDKIELMSYRTRKGTDEPIIHTERFFGPDIIRQIPKEYVGKGFVGELYGTHKGKAIPPQQLGGLLNASIANSLRKQKEKDIQLNLAAFDLLDTEGARKTRREALRRIVEGLGSDRIHVLPEVPGQAARPLWEQIRSGQHPLTSEGIVAWPEQGVPTKVKIFPERNVFIKNIFPEKRPGMAGGFEYSLTPEGPVVGRVGTGFDFQAKSQMMKEPEKWLGRKARITSQDQFGSGAYRAPAFVALQE